ncbi:MAG: transcription antitermination factor NusB [Planctomycetaceae bacterium]|nr:transcription antitermination factor NusB [Planctomycetaceae bacterium]
MSLRKQARKLVVQMLYQIDLNPDITAGEVRRMIDEHGRNKTTRSFAWQLFTGVMEYKPQLDEQIVRIAENWSLKRMAVTDRNILRLGAYELLHTDTPSAVVIDEAVELAREFGSAQSSQFVNGILDKLLHQPAEQAPPAQEQPAPAPPEKQESEADSSAKDEMAPRAPSPYRKSKNPWST